MKKKKTQAQITKERRDMRVFNREEALEKMARTYDEYKAAGMLLGMRFSGVSLCFYRNNGDHSLSYWHPDTMQPMSVADMRRRKQMIEMGEHPDAKIDFIR